MAERTPSGRQDWRLASVLARAPERRDIMLALAGLLVLVVTTTIVANAYVAAEHWVYYWDNANFQDLATKLADTFRGSRTGALRLLTRSLGDDYNLVFAVPLLPWTLVMGSSRAAFITGLTLVYLVPFALACGVLTRQVVTERRTAAFWLGAAAVALLAPAWIPVLRGYPDVGGAALLALAAAVFLGDTKLGSWRRVVVLAILIALAPVFRRPLAYATAALVASMALLILVSGLARLRIDRRGVREELIWPAVKLLVACAAAVAALSLLARPFVNAVVAVDFGALYASYRLPVTDVLAWFWTAVGPLVWVVAALGLIAAFAGPGAARSRVAFVGTFGVLALLTWAVWGGQVNGHYAYGFLPVVAAGLALGAHRLLLATTRAIGRTRGSLMVATVPGVPAVVALGLALLPAPPPALAGLMPVLSASAPPLVRNDLSELDRLVAHLQSTAAGEPIYVAASSFLLNWEVLPQAERQRARSRPASLRVLPGPDVDSRDAWPVSNLALADVVVFAEPFQHHLDPDQQRVARAGFDAFAEGWEISADFQREAERYRLDEGIEVSVYRRIRPTSLPRIHRTLAAVEAANPTRPSGPGDWILASGRPETTALYSDPSGIQTLLAPVGRPADPPTVLLSDRSAAQRVRGQLTVRSAACPAVELIVRERAADGSVLSEHRASGGPTTPTGIEIRLSGGAYDFVTLDVAPAAGVAVPAAGCDIELDALSLSGA